MNTVERARGRWKEILPRLGIECRFLVNKHGPCPLCGGRDRYRFDDRDGSGSYYCNQCGPGPGLMLIRKLHKWDHATACRAVDKILGNGPISPRPVAPKDSPAHRLAKIERVIADATDAEIVGNYLSTRGLSVVPAVLCGHRSLAYHDKCGRFVGKFPTMIAPMIGPDGRLQSVHRTYIADLPKKKTIMPPGYMAAPRQTSSGLRGMFMGARITSRWGLCAKRDIFMLNLNCLDAKSVYPLLC